MKNNTKVIKQLNTMFLLTVITQLIMLIKNAVVAAYFGISAELDAFHLANRISMFVYSFMGAGISTVIIPYLRDKINRKSINIFINVIYTSGFLLLVFMIVFRENIILVSSGNNNYLFIEMATNILIFTAVTNFINSIIQLTKGILEFHEKFNTEKIIVLFSNVILLIILLLGENNIYYYAFVLLVAALVNLIFHVIFVKKTKFKYGKNFDLKDEGFKEMMRLFFPTMLSTGVYQISLLIDTLIAARLPLGSISILNYANAVISMVNILLLGNITSFVYPKLVKKDSNQERQASLINYILLVNVLMSLLILLFYSSGEQVISILFERGEFNSENTAVVFLIALILTLSLPTNAIRDLLYRFFYMNKDTFTPFINSIIISVANIIISVILSIYFGLYGVVIGTVFASYISLVFIGVNFKKKFPIYFNKKKLLTENSKVILSTGVSIIASMIFKNVIYIENNFIGLIIYAMFSLIVFIILLKMFKSKIFNIEL